MATRTTRRRPSKRTVRTTQKNVTTARNEAKKALMKAVSNLVDHYKADKKITAAVKKNQKVRTAVSTARIAHAKRCRCGKCRGVSRR